MRCILPLIPFGSFSKNTILSGNFKSASRRRACSLISHASVTQRDKGEHPCSKTTGLPAVVLYMKGNAIRLEHVGSPFSRYGAFEAVPREKALEISPPREC